EDGSVGNSDGSGGSADGSIVPILPPDPNSPFNGLFPDPESVPPGWNPGGFECMLSDSCDGNNGNRSGQWGHPNIQTWDGVRYAFHGAGDYLFAEADEWVVHVRYSRLASMRRVSYVRALAVQVGDQVVSVGDAPDKTVWDDAKLRVDGQIVEIPERGTFELNAGIIYFSGEKWLILDDRGRGAIAGTSIGAAQQFRFPRLEAGDGVGGLAGSPDDDPSNDLQTATGELIDPSSFEELYDVFGASWLVDESESLFSTPLDPVDEQPIFPEAALLLADFDESVVREAEAVCRASGVVAGRGLNECVFDLVLTGDARWANATSTVAALTGSGVHWRLLDPRVTAERDISVGVEVSDQIDGSGAHRYRFEASAGERLVLRLSEPCGQSSPLTLVAGFEDPLGVVTESLPLTDCGDSKPLVVDSDGEYSLLVTDEQGVAAAFAFTLLRASDREMGNVSFGERIDGEFTTRSEIHTWSLDTRDESHFQISSSGASCEATWLVESSGVVIWTDDACATSPLITAAGDTRLVLIAEHPSSYNFSVFAVRSPQEVSIEPGEVARGEINQAGDSLSFRIEAAEGQLMQLFSDAGDCDLGRVWLDAPSGWSFPARSVCLDSGPYELPESGTWRVRVDPPR
ncbi:VWD domain-containing protein, partial [Acidimicrobiaceae bacterium AH-315-P05]|nr:VWD domain-containing protein [Acidimicrobiaceae bacterium AH-315-P05]